MTLTAQTGKLAAVENRKGDWLVTLLMLVNPTTLSAFAVWFGAFGLFSWRLLPIPVNFTVPIAIVSGLLGTKLTLALMGALTSRMYASNTFSQLNLIGMEAEVTVPFTKGQTGEITCVVGGPRYTFPARTVQEDCKFKRGGKVIIADVREEVAYVQPWPEDVLSLDELSH